MRRRYELIGSEGGRGPVILLFFRGRSWGVYLSVRTPRKHRAVYRLRIGVGPMFHWLNVGWARVPWFQILGPELKGKVVRV